jgi:integrase
MRALMGVIKDRHGTYYARRKVPKGLEEAVARVLANGKRRQSWLKRSLGTKNLHEANIRAKPVLMEFDGIIERARELLKETPTRTTLTSAEIKKMADYHYATVLGNDAAARRHARQIVEKFQDEPTADTPSYGLSEDEFQRIERSHRRELKAAQAALARGNIAFVEGEVEELLNDVFHIRLDRASASYRALGMAVLAEQVKAVQALQRRNAGEPIETPVQPEPEWTAAEPTGNTLRAAFEGWKRERRPAPRTLMEYERAIALFAQLHGDMPVIAIKKSHARHYREALQQVPRHRTGKLLKASLQDVVEWAKAHPNFPRLAPATVNKLIGGVQAVLIWAHDKGGFIPDDVPWADPFARMRLEEDKPEREPFDTSELQTLLRSPIFTDGERPKAGRGDAAYWLPVLALFTGCRRGELAGLTVADVAKDRARRAVMLTIIEDRESGKNLKTRNSQRVVPVHPQLRELGFLEFAEQRRADGEKAWLFPLVAPDKPGAAEAWTKWFGRYIRSLGITDKAKVFHSLRHNFIDALRAAGVDEELRSALAGHGWMSTINRGYGAKDMLRRFTPKTLVSAVAKVAYPGLDLSRLCSGKRRTRPRRRHRNTARSRSAQGARSAA